MQPIEIVGDEGRRRVYADAVMNRIREIREAAGLTQEELAEKAGTTATQIWRLENEHVQLNVSWMARLAEALACTPSDLIANAVLAEILGEVEEVEPDGVMVTIAKHRHLRAYRVLARSVIKAGIKPGDTITVDESDLATANLQPLDVVLVEMGRNKTKMLRLFVPPDMLITHRGGANLAITLDDPSAEPAIVGVVLRD